MCPRGRIPTLNGTEPIGRPTRSTAPARQHLDAVVRELLTSYAPSHGENRGSSPLGSANHFNNLRQNRKWLSNDCPINVRGQLWNPAQRKPAVSPFCFATT